MYSTIMKPIPTSWNAQLVQCYRYRCMLNFLPTKHLISATISANAKFLKHLLFIRLLTPELNFVVITFHPVQEMSLVKMQKDKLYNKRDQGLVPLLDFFL